VTKVREWWNPTTTDPKSGTSKATWSTILSHWAAIELDLDDRGHDIEALLHVRSWRWLRLRITDLTNTPGTRLHTALTKGT
jgi:hypothetical protein